MSNNVVVIYGAGASHASGHKVNISSKESHCPEKPLMDKDFFGNKYILSLVKSKYYAIRKFIELYFSGRKNVGLEELWTAVDLNYKHITLDTYDWIEETYENYLVGDYWENPNIIRYDNMNLRTNQRGAMQMVGGLRYDKYKFLSDCLRNLKCLVYDSLSDFVSDGTENYYLYLHKLIIKKSTLCGYITFNYDLMLEDSLDEMGTPFRYVNVGENVDDYTFLKGDYPIVKLHGSLNWQFVPTINYIIQDKKIQPIEPTYVSDGDFREPAIIPPTLFKQEINDETRAKEPLTLTILKQWRAAIRLLSVADKMIFVGYSFPPTDFHAKRIFQIAMMRRRAQKKKTKVLYCSGGDSNRGEIEDKLKNIFMLKSEKEIFIQNKFEELCGSKKLEEFLS